MTGSSGEANPYAPPRATLEPPAQGSATSSPLPDSGARLLTLAIVGLALCLALGLGFVLGLAVSVAARARLRQIAAGERDAAGEGLTRAALICGAIAALLGLAVVALGVALLAR